MSKVILNKIKAGDLELKEKVKFCVEWYNDIFKSEQPFLLSPNF